MRKRIIGKYFRFNNYENTRLKNIAIKSGLTESDVIRSLILNSEIKEAPPKEFYDIMEKINKIGININQLTKVANSTGNLYEEELRKQFDYIQILKMDLYKKYL